MRVNCRDSGVTPYAGLVTLVRDPVVGNAAFREQNQGSALWPMRCKRIP
jgi:hypothetical protein